jgi:hypothetical protein
MAQSKYYAPFYLHPLALLMPLSCQAKYEFVVRGLGSGRKNCLQSGRRAIVHVAMSTDEAMSADS